MSVNFTGLFFFRPSNDYSLSSSAHQLTVDLRKYAYLNLFFLPALFFACGSDSSTTDSEQLTSNDVERLFSSVLPGASGVDFANTLTFTEELNPYTYRNFFNGGGVGLGDFNGDGLLDIYLTGNLVDNKLYLNQGDFTFRDVTES
ncbi:MAG: VCBS repeat-containing protein, partial [Saprospiraceae bacterium]